VPATALNSRSTAAELGRVALLFQNASAISGYFSKLPIAVDFEARYPERYGNLHKV